MVEYQRLAAEPDSVNKRIPYFHRGRVKMKARKVALRASRQRRRDGGISPRVGFCGMKRLMAIESPGNSFYGALGRADLIFEAVGERLYYL